MDEVIYLDTGVDMYQCVGGNDLAYIHFVPIAWAYEQDNSNWMWSISGLNVVEVVFCFTLEEIAYWVSAPLQSPFQYRRIITAIRLNRWRDSEFVDERVVDTAVIEKRLMDKYGWTLAEFLEVPFAEIRVEHPLLANKFLTVTGPAKKGDPWLVWCEMHRQYILADTRSEAMNICANAHEYCLGCKMMSVWGKKQ